MLFKAPIPILPFIKWILSSKENKVLLITAMVISAISFTWFKTLYPFPNLFPDSYQYIAGALENRMIDYRPIGYTKFLQLIHAISSSHQFLVWTQYITLQVCQLYLLFTISYLLQPGKWMLRILVACCVLNPMIPHVSNIVSSDPLFTTLSIIWLTQLLWIIVKPNLRLILIHALVLFMAFAVRYNATFYPLISVLAILLCQSSKKSKYIGLAFIIILLGSFIGFTQSQFKKATGVVRFAPFNGWQIAANALVAYSHVSPDDPATFRGRFKKLHTVVNKYIDSIHRLPDNAIAESPSYYMWGEKSPILQYSESAVTSNYNHPEFKRWATIAPLFADYGRMLIKRHPGAYLRYIILSNFYSYNKPFPEYLGVYNMGYDRVGPAMVNWFKLSSSKIRPDDMDPKISVTTIISYSNGFINILFIIVFIGFSGMRGFYKCTQESKRVLYIMIIVCICNLGFSVLASPVQLRYLTFQIILTWLLVFLFLEFVAREYIVMSNQQHSREVINNRIPHKHKQYEQF